MVVILMASLGAAAVGLACTSIPEPAGRVLDGAPPSDASLAASDAGADASRCRGGGWRSLIGPGVLLATDTAGVEVLAGSGVYTEGDAGPVIYNIIATGRADQLAGKPPVDLATPKNKDLATCQYCGLVLGGCVQVTKDAISCETQYQAVSGQARTVLATTQDGGAYSLEVANVELVKVLRRDGFKIEETDPTDCIFLDRLTLQGTVIQIERPCSPAYDLYCQIADTAAQR